MNKPTVFETTLKNYLAQISDMDLRPRTEVLGASFDDGALILPFYGIPHRVSKNGVVVDGSGEKANFAVSVVLCCHVLQCPETVPDPGEWVTYREFKDAAPLTGYFTSNTHKIIETTFVGELAALEAACRRAGGRLLEEPSFDLAAVFEMLPRIPVYFRFNDRDDEFPAQSSLLFRQSAEAYLDMECLAIGGTYLTGLLINPASENEGSEISL
jgi:hypothetical protein